jgi:hypothetical protein
VATVVMAVPVAAGALAAAWSRYAAAAPPR